MRTDFYALALPARAAVERHTGPVYAWRSASSGVNSELAGILDTACGRVFLKGVRETDPEAAGLQREADVNPAVQSVVSPCLLWRETVEGWQLAAFEAINGRHADYSPGSTDLPKVAATLDAIAQLPCPLVPMFSASRRWGRFLDDPEDAQSFAGNALLHTDPNPSNYLITDERAWLVDWAWATRGAGFIDLACLIPRLIDEGHSPYEAEKWAGKHTVWQDADPAAVSLFARALARQWHGFADRNPNDEWRCSMAQAADKWAAYHARTTAAVSA